MDSLLPAGRVAEGTASKGESLGTVVVGEPGQNVFLCTAFLTLLPLIKDDFVKSSKALQWSVTGPQGSDLWACKVSLCGLQSWYGSGAPRAGNSNAMGPEQECLPEGIVLLVFPHGFPKFFLYGHKAQTGEAENRGNMFQ